MLTDILYKRCLPIKILKQENAEVLLMLNASVLLKSVKHPSFSLPFLVLPIISKEFSLIV